ncbi:MAG TPA: hypothetical protein VLX09_07950 [Stellaceae bacterium]|nr:hypothetical protein [Stellaceae bacterium]
MTKMVQNRKRGRPSRKIASEKALAGVDLSKVEPRAVLAAIAADVSAPATARVAACRALLLLEQPAQGEQQSDEVDGNDRITAIALKLLQGVK